MSSVRSKALTVILSLASVSLAMTAAQAASRLAGYDPTARTITTLKPDSLIKKEFDLHELQDRRLMAKRGDIHAAYEVGVLEQIRGNHPQALVWYRRSALFGHPLAAHNLGVMYYSGLGVDLDYDKAAKWVGKAAEDGLAPAQYLYGIMYLTGRGVSEDRSLERQWIERAARQNHALAQFHLGLILIDSEGAERDPVAGVAWISLAASQDVQIENVDVEHYLAYEVDRLDDVQRDRLAMVYEDLLSQGLGPGRDVIARETARYQTVRDIPE